MAYQVGDTLVRVHMTSSSGVPADDVINSYAFHLDHLATAVDAATILAKVDKVYNDVNGGSTKVGGYLGSDINRSATHEMRFYHIVAGSLGSPFAILPWLGPVAPVSPTNLPADVAGVLSMQADYTGTVEIGPVGTIPSTESAIDQGAPATHSGKTKPRARRRGRIYFGPLVDVAVLGSDNLPRLSPDFTAALRRAAVALEDANNVTLSGIWSVWSRTDQTLYEIVSGWTDDRPDGQSRRTQKTRVRTVWL